MSGVGAYVVPKYMMEPRYETKVTLYVSNNRNKMASDINAINTAKSLAKTYTKILKGNAFTKEVEKELESRYGRKGIEVGELKLGERMSVEVLDQTEIIEIKVQAKEAMLSKYLGKIVGEKAPEYLSKLTGEIGGVEIIAEAEEGELVFPQLPKMSLLGIIGGIVLTIIMILIKDSMDDSVKNGAELREIVGKGAVVLGEIEGIGSKGKRGKGKTGRRGLIYERGATFEEIEGYRRISNNIMIQLSLRDKKVVGISNVGDREGKGIEAADIAITIAKMGKTVLLIDGDMRRPEQHKNFKVGNREGLTTVILGESKLGEAIKDSGIEGLDIMTSGAKVANPAEILVSERFKEIIEKLEKYYEYIIIDTPPINIVSDAMVLRGNISGILLVVRSGDTRYEEVKESIREIEMAGIEQIGIVINGVKEKKHKRERGYENNDKIGKE